MKDDKEAFIFTLKNFFGVEPTRYKKKKESEYAIFCCNNDGPTFGNGGSFRSAIAADLNKWNCFSVFDYEVYALY